MRNLTVISTILSLSTILAACSNETAQSQNLTPPAVQQPADVSIIPFYIFTDAAQLRLVSGSAFTEEDKAQVPDGRLYVHDKQKDTYRPVTTTTQFGEHFYADGGALSSDNRTAYTVINANGDWILYSIELQSGQVIPLLNRSTAKQNGLTEVEGETLIVSPNGETLAFRGYTIHNDERSDETSHTNAIYTIDLKSGISAQNINRLTKINVQSSGNLPYPNFDETSRLIESPHQTTQVSAEVRGALQAQDLGIVGRLPYQGIAALTDTFHGTGMASGYSWGIGLDFGPRPRDVAKAARAISSGVVKNVYQSGCGVYLKVDHTTTTADTYYCHLETGSPASYGITDGKPVSEGQAMGLIGSTGAAAKHLHIALIQGDVYGFRGRDPTRAGCNIYSNNWVLLREYEFVANPC
ncbi:M23 family metallopeptidase [Deinococcus sp. QL22]|uniref:M23 family metallopeptidase n=1 Tax=Deinococcus sp. QL22 TaxID=2939437 RepID=UPI0020180C27|nr:M23 family metallopeptidase [Deinococcus sp. QL22]UQN07929.1 M23 family metallopeptidase [Deinococcus sp. QL22]